MKDKSSKKLSGNILEPEAFRKPLPGSRRPHAVSVADYLTFKNIVIFLGAATFLIFLGNIVSARMAFLFAALLGLTALVLMEMSSRRKWESDLLGQLRQMNGDYDRLVREVARNRNDMMVLKKTLADAGSLAKSYGNKPAPEKQEAGAIEQRMIGAIAEQLSKLSAPRRNDGDHSMAALGLAEIEQELPPETLPEDVGKTLSDEQVLQLVSVAVQQDRVDLFLQPIVNLPQRKVRFYEMFSRIRITPEVYLPAERYIAVALKNDMVPAIDNLLLLRGLQLIRDTEEENFNRAFFCNITSLTLNDPKFMGDLVEFISQNRLLAPKLVFELGQRDLATMSPDALPVLEGLTNLGCRFSMDQVKSLSFDFAHLEARHIRFIKVNAAILMREMKETGGLARMKRMKSELDANGIDLIVEKVETDRQLLEMLDIDIDYGQGFLFGRPEISEAI